MPVDQTIVKYNGVVLYHCLTMRWNQEPVNDPTGTDRMFDKFTIGVVGYCHAKGNSTGIRSEPVASTTALQHKDVRQLLNEPRREFEYIVGADELGDGGETLLKAQHATLSDTRLTERDVNDGPRCIQFDIQQVVGEELFKVHAVFEVSVVECLRDANYSRILNNRWSCTDAIDRDRYTTRVYRGSLRVTSGEINPNTFRGHVVPVLVNGMRRESMLFECAQDGKHLNYTIIDKEAAFSAPKPATSWSVEHTEYAGDGMLGYGEIRLELTGDRDVDKKKLIQLGVKIIDDRLRGINVLARNPDHKVESVTVTDRISSEGPSSIAMTARVQHVKQGRDGEENLVFQQGRLGRPIDDLALKQPYNRNESLDGRPGEQVQVQGPVPLVLAFVTYLQSACSDIHDMCVASGDLSGSLELCDKSPPKMEIRTFPELPDEPMPYTSDQHRAAIYTHYRAESIYDWHHGRVALPVARAGDTAGQTNTPTTAVVRIFPPVTRRILRMEGTRVGREVHFPEPLDRYTDENGITFTLLDHKLLPATADRAADGKQVYHARAEYVYALSRNPTAQEKLTIGVNPWEGNGRHEMASLANTYNEREVGVA